MIYANLTSMDLPCNLKRNFYFPMGEFHVEVPSTKDNLTVFYQFPRDVMQPILVADAWAANINESGREVTLVCPYLPYARQDRVAVPGEPNSRDTILGMFSKHFDKIITYDIHSSFVDDDNYVYIENVEQHTIAAKAVEDYWPKFIVAPDKGAKEKAAKLASLYKLPLVVCNKKRDSATGKLCGFEIAEGEEAAKSGMKGLIVDDICDGGGTFLGLVDLFSGPLALYVTHGGFTKGLSGLFEKFDKIYTTNSLTPSQEDRNSKKLKVFDIWSNHIEIKKIV